MRKKRIRGSERRGEQRRTKGEGREEKDNNKKKQ